MPENSTNQPVNRSANALVIAAVIVMLVLLGLGARKVLFDSSDLTDPGTATNSPAISTGQ